MTRFLKTAALVAALVPAAAQADSIILGAPMQGASLSEAGIDMSVYFTERDDGAYEVVATYAAQSNPSDAQRLTMALGGDDAVRFSLPGHLDTIYGFARSGDGVTVTVVPGERQLAANL